MSNNKHSPGPWALGTPETEDHQPTPDGQWIDINAKGHTGIARVVWRMEDDERSPIMEANARVMVAAPTAFGLLQELVDEVYVPDANCSCHLSPPCNDCVEHGHLRSLLQTAKALIAEIEGEQS
jgi:hypothetical protein